MTTLKELFEQHQKALSGGLFLQALADLEEFSRRLRRRLGQLTAPVKDPKAVERDLDALLEAARRLSPDHPQDVAALLRHENRFQTLLGHLYEDH